MNLDVLTTVYIGNAIGLALLLTLLFSNKERISGDRDLESIFRLIIIGMSGCVTDSLAYTIDGIPGKAITVLIYLANSWLFLANMLVGKLWINFVVEHLNTPISKKTRLFLNSMFTFGVVCLLVNFFYPIAFDVKNNIYERSYLYWIFVLIAGIHMLVSVFVYYKAKFKSGVYMFSIYSFLIPVVVGVIVQSAFYGISVIWPSIAIAFAGVMSAMKNEIIFMDKLTGIYNRVYLEYLQKDLIKKKSAYVTGMMIDLNDFKSINDRFGHATGDDALIVAADILRKTTGSRGNVMRYAGDEFVILVNTVDEKKINDLVISLNKAFEKFNNTNEKPYKLSISYGYAALDLKNQTMNDFMNTIDRKMYDYKANYYNKMGMDRRK